MSDTTFNPFTNNIDFTGSGGSGNISSSGTITDNSIVRGDGGVRNIQDSGILIDDSDNITAVASITLDAGTNITEFSTDGTLAGDSDNALPTEKAVKAYVDAAIPPKEYWFAAESLQPLESSFAPLEKLDGTNVKTFVRAFHTTTEEFANCKIQVPGDVDASGTVTFRWYAMAKAAVALKNVKLTVGHRPINDSEDFDQAYTDKSWDDEAIDGTQDDVTEFALTETVSNLGWAANDLVFLRFSREEATTNNLADDMYLFSVCVELPRSS
jgi:hypothetical protein